MPANRAEALPGFEVAGCTASRRRQNVPPRYLGCAQKSSGTATGRTNASASSRPTRNRSATRRRGPPRRCSPSSSTGPSSSRRAVRSWTEKTESGSKRKAARAPFRALAHGEIRCQSGFCLFFPRDASIDAVPAQAPPRELCHDLRMHPSARATGTAAGSEACPEFARWLSFLDVS